MSCNLTEHLECDFIDIFADINSKYILDDEDGGGIYTRYVTDLESEIRLLADLSMIVEMKMERIRDKYCAYE